MLYCRRDNAHTKNSHGAFQKFVIRLSIDEHIETVFEKLIQKRKRNRVITYEQYG